MLETKTKKVIFALFLIPLAGLFAMLFNTGITDPSFAAVNCQPTKTSYSLSADGATITQSITGQKEVNPGTSYTSCADVNETHTFSEKGSGLVYQEANANKCGDQITLANAPQAGATVSAKYQSYQVSAGCIPVNNPTTFTLTVGTNYSGTAGTATPTPSTDPKTSCAISDGLGWLLCPLFKLGGGIADAGLGFISGSFLEVNTQLYSTNSATYSGWQWVLGFANIFFVIIFLIIIFSQATGYGISNYGIKKMLPKLIIGVILINLSFFICSLMIDASNLTGYGLNHFFDTLSKGIPLPANSDIGASGSPFTDIVSYIIGGAVVGTAVVAGIAFFAPVLLAAVVALLMIFLFLVARQAIIVLGIIVAPLAFAAWLLPNTEKFFKQWWKIFVDMLLVFPIIGLVFGASKLVSRILTSVYAGNAAPAGTPSSVALVWSLTANGKGNLLGQIIAAAVLVVPLFAVPFILKGILDSVPAVGKWAQKAYGGAVGGTRKGASKLGSPYFENLAKGRRSGALTWYGRKRSDEARAKRRTVGQTWADHRRNVDKQGKNFDEAGELAYQERSLSPGTYQYRDKDGNLQTGKRSGLAAASARRAQSLEQDRRANAQAKVAATNLETAQYTERLRSNEDFLQKAAGNVAPDGKVLASAFAARDLAEQEEKRVKAVRYLGDNGSEQLLLNGFRYNKDNGTWSHHSVDKYGNAVIENNQSTVRDLMEKRNILQKGQQLNEIPEATLTSIGHLQDYQRTTYGAEAIALNAAEQKILKAEDLRQLVNNAGGTNIEQAELVSRLNAGLSKIGGMEDMAYSGITVDGKIDYGQLKGGMQNVYQGYVDQQGLKGFHKKYLQDTQSEFEVMVEADGSERPIDPTTGKPKPRKVSRAQLATEIIDRKMNSRDPGERESFNASLVNTDDEVINLTAFELAKLHNPGVAVSKDPRDASYSYVSTELAELRGRQKAARPQTQGSASAGGGGASGGGTSGP